MTADRWRDVIRQAMVCLPGGFLHLLAQKIKRRKLFRSRFVRIKIDIVAHGVCRPKSVNSSRRERIFCDDRVEKFLGVIKKLARLFANYRIIEDRRITSTQLPGMEERRPIDVVD